VLPQLKGSNSKTSNLGEKNQEEEISDRKVERWQNQNFETVMEKKRHTLENKLNDKKALYNEQTNLFQLINQEIENYELDVTSREAVIKIEEVNEKKKTSNFENFLFNARATGVNVSEERDKFTFLRKAYQVKLKSH